MKHPYADADINTIKFMIKAKNGRRPRFNGREQLLDILEHANSADVIDSGYRDISDIKYEMNKAGYTATPVACGWAGAVFEIT